MHQGEITGPQRKHKRQAAARMLVEVVLFTASPLSGLVYCCHLPLKQPFLLRLESLSLVATFTVAIDDGSASGHHCRSSRAVTLKAFFFPWTFFAPQSFSRHCRALISTDLLNAFFFPWTFFAPRSLSRQYRDMLLFPWTVFACMFWNDQSHSASLFKVSYSKPMFRKCKAGKRGLGCITFQTYVSQL